MIGIIDFAIRTVPTDLFVNLSEFLMILFIFLTLIFFKFLKFFDVFIINQYQTHLILSLDRSNGAKNMKSIYATFCGADVITAQ